MKKTALSLQEQLLDILKSQPHRQFKTKELARLLKIAPRDYKAFRTLLHELAEQRVIARFKSNRFGIAKPSSTVVGKLHVKTQGYGFLLTPEGEEDIFIGNKNMGTAFDGDVIRVQLFATPKGKRPEGKVVEVVERFRRQIVGTLRRGKYYYYVVPDDLKINRDIYLHEKALNGAKEGQKVSVEIEDWHDELLNPEGKVVKILGYPGEPGVDVLSVAASFDLPMAFPARVEEEARRIPDQVTKQEIKKRLDLRDTVCFTIDPEDAKDFDDAVSLLRLVNGNYELGVHIADVSHYVAEGTALDQEAANRGTSVYLVDRVVPMLPERLSNDLCSLKPQIDRLTFSCLMELTPEGSIVRHRIAPSVIHSNKRFTYEEAQAVLDRKLEVASELAEPLREMAKLARLLRQRRAQAGSLNFDTPEAKVILDTNGNPVDIKRRETLETMQMIEEFMLAANRTVAMHIEKYATEKIAPPFIYRIHERPAREKMEKFAEFLKALGYEFGIQGRMTPKKLSQFISSIRGTDEELIIENVMLRSLMKARYDVENVGHFGLAFKHYTHFTSPIRRYPDLAVHRLLKYYASEGWHEELRDAFLAKLDAICKHASEREIVAQEAERASIKMKQAEFMARHLGDEFEGIISGVVHFGIFVEITRYLVEGLVHIDDLDDDYYIYHEKTFTLEGRSTGRRFRIGDPVRVKVVRVDQDERIIDFVLVEKLRKRRRQKRTRSKRGA